MTDQVTVKLTVKMAVKMTADVILEMTVKMTVKMTAGIILEVTVKVPAEVAIEMTVKVTVKVIIEVTCLIRQEEQNGLMISRNKYLGTNNDLTSTTIAQLRVVTTCLQCAMHDCMTIGVPLMSH